MPGFAEEEICWTWSVAVLQQIVRVLHGDAMHRPKYCGANSLNDNSQFVKKEEEEEKKKKKKKNNNNNSKTTTTT